MKATLEDLAKPQREALLQFRREAGPTWKAKLLAAWRLGVDERLPGGLWLRQIRNDRGPEWLEHLSTP